MKRYWWHCTSEYHGERWTAVRRCPRHRSQSEPDTPRLCVSPTVAECFAAVLFKKCKPVYCYQTEKKCSGITPRNVWDSVVTREAWLIPPVSMVLSKTIASVDVQAAQEFVRLYHTTTRRGSTLHVRVAQLMCAANVVGCEWIRERAKRCMAICNIQDAEQYLFELCELDPL